MAASFVPEHKAPMVLFLDRVYGVESQEFLLHVLEVGFLPDMRAAASLDTVRPPAAAPTKPLGWVWGPLKPARPHGMGLGSSPSALYLLQHLI